MNAIKFDEESVKKCIEAYYLQHDKYPYLIMNEDTYKILPTDTCTITYNSEQCKVVGMMLGNVATTQLDANSLKIGDAVYVLNDEKPKSYGTWHGARILLDGKMKFGEVHIG